MSQQSHQVRLRVAAAVLRPQPQLRSRNLFLSYFGKDLNRCQYQNIRMKIHFLRTQMNQESSDCQNFQVKNPRKLLIFIKCTWYTQKLELVSEFEQIHINAETAPKGQEI